MHKFLYLFCDTFLYGIFKILFIESVLTSVQFLLKELELKEQQQLPS